VDLVEPDGAQGKVRGIQYQANVYSLAISAIRIALVGVEYMPHEKAVQLLKNTLVARDGVLANLHDLKDHNVVLEGGFRVSDSVTIPCGLSKGALLSMHDEAQMNSEVIDGFIGSVLQARMEVVDDPPPTFVPAKLMPSKPTDSVPELGWSWINEYLAGATTFVFLIHEECVVGESGHFILLYVDTTKDVVHVLDPMFTVVSKHSVITRLKSLSHLKDWVPAFFAAHGVPIMHTKLRLKMALPMTHRRATTAWKNLSALWRPELTSTLCMHTQLDAVSCGVVCAQVVSHWVCTGKSPSVNVPLEDCATYRGKMLHALRKGLWFAGEELECFHEA
jgi:hypothetical protein